MDWLSHCKTYLQCLGLSPSRSGVEGIPGGVQIQRPEAPDFSRAATGRLTFPGRAIRLLIEATHRPFFGL